MSRASSKSKDVAEEVKSDSEDSMASDESDDDDRREETPDLYRNSALGIYAGVSPTRTFVYQGSQHLIGNGRGSS